MATRDTFTSATVGAVSGDDFMDNVAGHIAALYNASALPLTGVAGTANAVTATLDPPLSAALVVGMKFGITWAADNTAGVTLAINGATALPVLTASAGGLPSGALAAGRRDLLEFTGGAFRVLTSAGTAGGADSYYFAFTASGTLTLPVGLEDDRMVMIEAWGAGGGGSSTPATGYSGAGGAYARRMVRYGDLPSSLTVTVGAGGAQNVNGGNTTVGAVLTAYGGGGGFTSAGNQSGGGGALSAGISSLTAGAVRNGRGWSNLWGGAPGAQGSNGFDAVFGGASGGANTGAIGGLSAFGGDGGAHGVAGSAPGGGGGTAAAGARGEVRVWI